MPALISSAKASSNFSPVYGAAMLPSSDAAGRNGAACLGEEKKKKKKNVRRRKPASADVLGARVGIFCFFCFFCRRSHK